MVVRSGHDALGRWCQEERPLGWPTAGRIVRVWLIAASVLSRRDGQCEYGAIELQAGETILTVN